MRHIAVRFPQSPQLNPNSWLWEAGNSSVSSVPQFLSPHRAKGTGFSTEEARCRLNGPTVPALGQEPAAAAAAGTHLTGLQRGRFLFPQFLSSSSVNLATEEGALL